MGYNGWCGVGVRLVIRDGGWYNNRFSTGVGMRQVRGGRLGWKGGIGQLMGLEVDRGEVGCTGWG